MLWVYGQYILFTFSVWRSTLESDVIRRHILTSNDDPRAVRVNVVSILFYRLQRWFKIKTTLNKRFTFAVMSVRISNTFSILVKWHKKHRLRFSITLKHEAMCTMRAPFVYMVNTSLFTAYLPF